MFEKENLIATKNFRFGNKALRAGDPLVTSRQDARTLVAIGRARRMTADEKKPKRPSKRRDTEAD